MIMMLRQQIATSRKGSFPSLLQRAFAKLVERPALKPKYDNYIGRYTRILKTYSNFQDVTLILSRIYLKLALSSKMLIYSFQVASLWHPLKDNTLITSRLLTAKFSLPQRDLADSILSS